MSKVTDIRDPKALQEVASHLENTVVRQHKEIARLRLENARLRGQDVSPQMEFDLLKEQLDAMKRSMFGLSSERRPENSGNGDQKQDKREKKPKSGHGPRSQPDLPIEKVVHRLAEDEHTCSFCGGEVDEWPEQFEESEEITVVSLEYKILHHSRQKYRCGCNSQVVTAPGAVKLTPGGRYSIDFAAQVAENKYLDHMPLERQVRAMQRAGLIVDSQTLWDQIEKLAQHLQPTYEALLELALKAGVIYADETRWQIMMKNNSCRWWTWCVATDEIATYRIFSSRSQKAAAKMLGEYGRVAMTDGYAAYDALVKNGEANPNLTIAHCWAHVRRKFIEAEDAYPELSKPAITMIKDLYRIEKKIPLITADTSENERKQLLDLRHKIRQQESRPKIDEIRNWAFENLPNTLTESKMGKALNYMLKLWPGLTVFLGNPEVPLDNNAAERALRGVVVGRKNDYGSRSKRGTEVAALFYTMMETAKLSGIDAKVYLREAATRAIKTPGTVTLPNHLT
jgi:transposase